MKQLRDGNPTCIVNEILAVTFRIQESKNYPEVRLGKRGRDLLERRLGIVCGMRPPLTRGLQCGSNVVHLIDTTNAGLAYSGKSGFSIQPKSPVPGSRLRLLAFPRLGPLFRGDGAPRGHRLRRHLHMAIGPLPDRRKRSARIERPFPLVCVSSLHMVRGRVPA